MDHLIGQRFNLISKSEIRYLGTLHEINPEDSTIALEDVYSFGTEDRQVDSFIPPSQHKFDYIVFRGGDVKDIKIAEDQKENKQQTPPNIPNDPAILNASRPGPPSQGAPRDQSPFHPGYNGPPPQFGGYYPPQHYRGGFGPPGPPGGFGPGPGFHGPGPYGPPPPGYFAPPGQGFPGPNQFHPPPPIGTPPGQRPPPDHQNQAPSSSAPKQTPQPTSELPVDNRAPPQPAAKVGPPVSQRGNEASLNATKPTPPVPAAQASPATFAAAAASAAPKTAPTGPKNNRVTPAVPMTVNQKSFVPPIQPVANGPLSSAPGNVTTKAPMPTQEAMEAASRQAKEAVAAAMAKLNPQPTSSAPKPAATAAALEALTRKVSEMKTNESSPRGNRGGFRGRGNYQRNGSGGQPSRKIEIPTSDYDFESANAKFNKDDLIKEATASGSPIGETPESTTNGIPETEPATNGISRKDSLPTSNEKVYDKKSSFFDNISSEAKDREDATDRPGGRVFRGEEYKKNMETFGQGTVDTGYRGRGRGFRGRGYGGGFRGYNRGFSGPRAGGNFAGNPGRGRGRSGSESAPTPAAGGDGW